ncbi:MAG: YraN family protein [Muribaculaceae bacterium]|nr:YraN family protein [Muribaculaceae bacterium]
MSETSQLGVWGEEIACQTLISKGYAIIARNTRIAHIEVDILAMYGNRIVVAEVKTRRDASFDPTFGITPDKIRRLARAGATYVRTYKLPHEVQIDLIRIIGHPDSDYRIEHQPDAFMPPRSRARRR